MDAIVVKKIIDQHMENIVGTIAFCYGEKYEDVIKERLNEVPYYVYDNTRYTISRLENIDLMRIAVEFVKDITVDLNVSYEKKILIEHDLANVLYISRNFGINEILLSRVIKNWPEIELNLEELKEKLTTLKNYYNDDYEVKKIDSELLSCHSKIKLFDAEMLKYKETVLKNIVHLDKNECDDISYLWDLLVYFSDSLNPTQNEEKLEYQEEFYSLIGCKGDSLEELIEDAKIKGIYVNSDVYEKIVEQYNKTFKEKFAKLAEEQSNIKLIFDDLSNRGINIANDFISSYLMSDNCASASVFSACSSSDKKFNVIVYNNGLSLYSKDSTEIIIHELLHIIGGHNKEFLKNGLFYEVDRKYLHLEEAYVNYLAKKIASIYNKNYGIIMPVEHNQPDPCIYDKTLSYFDVVFKKYGKQLMEIQLSDTLSLKEANKIIPITQIATSIEKIMNSDVNDIEGVIAKEINKKGRSV